MNRAPGTIATNREGDIVLPLFVDSHEIGAMLRALLLVSAIGIVAASSQAADMRARPKPPPATSASCVEESLCEGACVNGKGCRIMTCANKTWRWFGQTCGANGKAKCGKHPSCPKA